MPSERVQRQIDRLLDEAEAALAATDWPLVRQRCEAALSLDPENGDARAYLDAADRASNWPGTSAAVPPPPRTPSIEQPTSFANGRYVVRRFLGEGGKKKVYLAHDELLDRDVAFALIKTVGLDAVGRERIVREAQTMGRLGAHPHIVTIFEIGEESGAPYVVTELLGGGDVEGRIEQAPEHRLSLAEVLRLGEEVCQGLVFAHEHGVVHRDLKPGNVWLTSDGRAKIGDFGLAVALDRSRLTQMGMMVGTASYMPPEQALGGDVTARSDLYSLGAMLYEAVTGRPPFVGDESVAIIGQHLNTPPVAPSWHRPDCPPGLEALILRLLEKDPARRPASAAEVREALLVISTRAAPSTSGRRPDVEASAHGPEHGGLYQRIFVGRESELGQLTAAFDGALSGQGAIAMVVGEPGIGKTSLVEQLATYVALRGGRALWGHCYEEGSLALPYLAFVEALRTYVLERETEALRGELGTGAGEVARIVSEVRDRVQVSPADTGDPEEQRYRLMTAVTTFLRNASAVQPLLIVLEDLHDADRGTLDLLLHLARNLQGARLLVIGTYRDVEVDRAHPLSATLAELRRAHAFIRVPLRGLSPDEVHRMMSQVRGQEVQRSRAEAVWRQTEGNPLFVQEVLRYLVEAGLVVREGDRYVRVDDGGDPAAGIPEGLRDVIGKRLSRLTPETNALLGIAAVQGRDFRLDVLQAVANAPHEEVERALQEASERAIVEERSALGALAFRFTHAFFRQTLYEELFAARRLRLHQQVGRALEHAYGARAEEHAAELAEHFAQSTDPVDLERALAYAETAAARAFAVYAYGDAARELDRALKLVEVIAPEDLGKRCDLLLALGEALMPAGEPQRVYEVVAEEAFVLAEALGAPDRASQACRLAFIALNRSRAAMASSTPAFRGWADRAEAVAEPGTHARVRALQARAAVLRVDGRRGEAWPVHLQAIELARDIGQPEELFSAAGGILGQDASPRHEHFRRQLADEVLTWPREGVNTYNLAATISFAASSILNWGDRERTEEIWREIQALAERTRDPSPGLRVLAQKGYAYVLDGELEAAVEVGTELLRRSEEVGQVPAGSGYAYLVSMRPLMLLGLADDALAFSRRVVVTNGPSREAVALLHSGKALEAAEAAERIAAQVARGPEANEAPVDALVMLLEVAIGTGKHELAAELASLLEPAAGMAHITFTCPARHLGAASALLGEREEARAYYLQALEVSAKIRFRPEIALTHLGLAELLLSQYPDERTQALEHLDFAIEEFRAMKMQPSLERALRHRDLLKA